MTDYRAIYDEVYSSGTTPKPAYAGMDDATIAAALNAQTVPDTGPIDIAALKLKAIEERIWGKLNSFANRVFNSNATIQGKTDAARNFLAIFDSLGSAPLVRNNNLWLAMDADLTALQTAGTDGAVLTAGQATYMRNLGDRTRSRWGETITGGNVATARATYGGG